MTDMTIANVILEQLGHRRFIVMTGAKNLVGGERTLAFHLPIIRKFFEVKLEYNDTYTLSLFTIDRKNGTRKVKTMLADVYCDNLRETFESMTGLYTSL